MPSAGVAVAMASKVVAQLCIITCFVQAGAQQEGTIYTSTPNSSPRADLPTHPVSARISWRKLSTSDQEGDCHTSFSSGVASCMPLAERDESNPLAMCKTECLGPVNRALGLCNNGETFDDDGELKSIAEFLGVILSMCTQGPPAPGPLQGGSCQASFSSGMANCMPLAQQDVSNPLAMCKTECLGPVNSALDLCKNGEIFDDDGEMKSIAEFLGGILSMCAQGPPAPGPPQGGDCHASFSSGMAKCMPLAQQDESNPLAMCKTECLGPVNSALDLCKNGETFDDDGEMKSIAELLGGILSMCTQGPPAPGPPQGGDCQASFSSGMAICMPFAQQDESNPLAMCKTECLGPVNSALGLCKNGETFDDDGEMKSIAEFLGGILSTCTQGPPAPGPQQGGDCHASFSSGMEKCMPLAQQDESNPLAMCKPECLGPVNRTLGLCKNGETFDDDGETKSMAEFLGGILSMCTDHCLAAFMEMQSSGCIPKASGDDSQAVMCGDVCKGKIEHFPAECHEKKMSLSQDMTLGKALEGIPKMCDASVPAPPPSTAGCVKISRAMAARYKAVLCGS